MIHKHTARFILLVCSAAVTLNLFVATPTQATIPTGDFSIEVSPSPLFATVEPGAPTTVELRIRNASVQPEELKIETRAFSMSNDSQSINLSSSTPDTLAKWVSYANPIFSVDPQAWFTEKITVTMPAEAGFSYPFAVVISRSKDTATDPTNGRLLKGSVAVFMLINVNKPGATRSLTIESLTTSRPAYEYLPATIQLRLKNTGNSIVQPYGNFYIQRGENDNTPLALLPVNDNHGYILPGASRDFTAVWDDGYPVYKKDTNGSQYTDWESKKVSKFRFGKYTAKVVAVYNDGTRDVPLTGTTVFWVIPWKIALGILVALGILGIGVMTIVRSTIRKIRKLHHNEQPS